MTSFWYCLTSAFLGWWTERAGTDRAGYVLIDWLEETLELAGASLFLVALVDVVPIT